MEAVSYFDQCFHLASHWRSRSLVSLISPEIACIKDENMLGVFRHVSHTAYM